jgi:regulator of sigma E protease
MIVSLLALIVVLGVLIFIHELGHFVAAKWAGIYVHRFSLGMGSPIKALSFKRGETEYAVSWLPLGGYVKMASAEEEALARLEGGQAHTPVPPDRMFEAKPVWKRIIVIIAGVTMNLLFAWAIYSGLALYSGRTLTLETRVGMVDSTLMPKDGEALATLVPGDRIVAINADTVHTWNDVADALQNAAGSSLRILMASGTSVTLPIPADAVGERMTTALAVQPWRAPVLATVDSTGPAFRAGLRAGDSVTAMNGAPIQQWYQLQEIIEARPNAPVRLTIVRDGQPREFSVVTDSQVVADTGKATKVVGRLGVGSQLPTRHESIGLPGSISAGAEQTVGVMVQIGRSVKGMLTGEVAGKELGGPILIGQLAGQTARLGLVAFLSFMAFISVNLAVLNFLPIPLLDGGQFVFLIAEAALGRPLPLKLREVLSMVGLVLLVLIMIFAFSNDLRRVLAGWLG